VNVAAAKLLLPWLAHAVAELQRRRHEREELRLLDSCALRDLGLDRSELGSCQAEATGAAHCTRRRIAGV
jgi:uncharacterized protein YjiS (DUF1127 family)